MPELGESLQAIVTKTLELDQLCKQADEEHDIGTLFLHLWPFSRTEDMRGFIEAFLERTDAP